MLKIKKFKVCYSREITYGMDDFTEIFKNLQYISENNFIESLK